MELWIAFVVVLAVFLAWLLHSNKSMLPRAYEEKEVYVSGVDPRRAFYQGLTKEEKYEALSHADSFAEVQEMWVAFQERGYSEGGQLHASCLQRCADFGHALSAHQQEIINKANEPNTLPPITGHFGRPFGA